MSRSFGRFSKFPRFSVLAAASLAWLLVGSLSATVAAQDAPPAAEIAQPAPVVALAAGNLKVSVGDTPAVEVQLPCAGATLQVVNNMAYVGCGVDGLVMVNLSDPASPKVDGHQRFDGAVAGVFELDGAVWVRLSHVDARPLDQAGRVVSPDLTAPVVMAPGAAKEKKATAEPAGPVPVGRVVEVRSGSVILDIGATAGVKRAEHIELFIEVERSLGDGETAIEEVQLAVARVSAVTSKRSVVRLALNEEVPVGALARETKKSLTQSTMNPRRADDLWEVAFTVRPFLALGTFGFGAVSEGSVAYRFEGPLVVRALFQPVGIGIAESGNILALGGNVVAAYDTRLFEVGAGLGWASFNDSPGRTYAADATKDDGSGFERVNTAMSIVQSVRLGSRDGLALFLDNSFVLYEDEFMYGGSSGTLQVPTSERSWLLFQGAGGISSYWRADLGIRVLVRGNGERDSLFMTATLGAAGLYGEKDVVCPDWAREGEDCYDEISYGGPAAGFGLEWRF